MNDADLDDRLLTATTQGDIDQIKDLLERGANIDANDEGRTACFYAVREGHTSCLEYLIEHGARVDDCDEYFGCTPLILAAERGREECLALLIKHGGDILHVDGAGMTALHRAAEGGHIDCVKMLIKAGVDVHSLSVRGETALHCAAGSNQLECAKLLIGLGVDHRLKDSNGYSALQRSTLNGGCLDCVKYMIELGYPEDEELSALESAKRTFRHDLVLFMERYLAMKGEMNALNGAIGPLVKPDLAIAF